MTRNAVRVWVDRFAGLVVNALAVLAIVPLGLVLLYVARNGWASAIDPNFYVNVFRPVGIPGGGVFHAIVGTIELVAMASAIALPIGILGGIYLAEYREERWSDVVRITSDVLVGVPSIALGLIAYTLIVVPAKHFSAFSGSVALAVLMLPIVIRTTESAVALVPGGLREAGVALGLPRWRVSLQLVLRAAVSGVVTGALLAVARAGGEAAPLLFTAFGNHILSTDPNRAIAALPLVIYQQALTPYADLQQQAWGAALVLVIIVLVINLGSRFALRRQIAMAGKL